MSDRWSLDPRADLCLRHWGGETVVHHLLSNDTHRLAEPAGWVLDRLRAGGALAADDIAAGSPYDGADLGPVLEALSQLGFVVQC